MFNLSMANAKSAEITASANEVTKGYADAKKETAKKIFTLPKAEASTLAGDLVNSVSCLYRPMMGEFLHTTSIYGTDKVDNVEVSVRSKLKSDKKFKYVFNSANADSLVPELLKFFTACTIDISLIDMACENIKELNAFIEAACEEAETPVYVKFVYGADNGVDVTDEAITFELSSKPAVSIGDVIMFKVIENASDYSQFEKDCQRSRFISFLKSVQTPIEFLKCNDSFFVSIVPFRARKRVDCILREKYHKNYKTAGRYKSATYYLNEVVNVDGEDVKVFALVKVDGDAVTTVLSPFNVRSLIKVDYDVVGAVKAVMG